MILLLSLYFGSGLLLCTGAEWAMSRMRRLDAAERLQEASWAITEEWSPCRRCGDPAEPPNKICKGCR